VYYYIIGRLHPGGKKTLNNGGEFEQNMQLIALGAYSLEAYSLGAITRFGLLENTST
jgi:hypothetical protein